MDAENIKVDEKSTETVEKVENIDENVQNKDAENIGIDENSTETIAILKNIAENVQNKDVEANSEAPKDAENIGIDENSTETIAIVENIAENVQNKDVEANSETPKVDEVEKVENEETQESNIDDSTTSNMQGMGLSMIAQYDSDADDKGSEAVPYRQQAANVDSDTDSDTSTDESICSVERFSFKKEKKALARMLSDCSDDDDEDNKSPKQRQQPKVKGELLLEDLPPIEDLYITVPEDECVELGKVHSIVDQLVLVSALPNSLLVDLETVLFLHKGTKVLGAVFDVLGQISEPLYCVRFNSNEQIKEKKINVGDVVYVAPKTEYTQFIILSNLMKMRGSDASWENDVEPPPRFIDYSDDEEERQARARARNKDRRTDPEHAVQQKRPMNEDTDNDSNASFDTRPAYRRHAAGPSRGRGRGMQHAFNQAYPMPHAGSWHSNYFPPPHMYYPPHGMHMLPPNMPYPPAYNYNAPPPAPPGTSHYDNNNM